MIQPQSHFTFFASATRSLFIGAVAPQRLTTVVSQPDNESTASFDALVKQLVASDATPQEAFAQLETCMHSLVVRAKIPVDQRILRAIAVIRETYAQNLSVGAVAGLVGLSVPRLSQLFKQWVGVPIRRFRQWCRLVAASARIRQGYPMTEAALESGFSDYSQFCRVFREMTGTPPSMAL